MTSTIEKVARAYCWDTCKRAVDPNDCGGCGSSDECVHWRAFDSRARAAIAAILEDMRSPEERVKDAGAFYCIRGAGGATEGDLRQAASVWQAMLTQYAKEVLDE